MAQAHIGSIYFRYPLKWVNKGDVVTIGSKSRTLTGDLCIVTAESPSQKSIEAKLLFEWETKAHVDALRAMWLSGGTHSADLEGSGTSYTVRFDPECGVVSPEHEVGKPVVHYHFEGSDNDLYHGELNLIIET